MSYFPEMEWNSNWDWESFKKNQLVPDWVTVDEAIGFGPSSFNTSGLGGSSGTSTKSSISVSGNSPLPEGSIGSMEPMISLELGERTYFENNSIRSASFPVVPNLSATTAPKKLRSSSQNAPIPRCQVEGCNLDLSTAKEYHRKHRVCDNHSKCSKVVIKGLERRFCQQCSRFHSLSEFDDKKRSCRRRLSDHNARRRKPHQESNQFNSTRLSSSPFYGGRQQVSFMLNNVPYLHSKTPAAYSTWDSESNSKFTLTKGYPSSTNGNGLITDEQQFHMPGFKTPHIINMLGNAANGLLPSKSSTSEFLYPGTNGSLISSSNLDAATSTEYRCALSLLSKKAWGSSCTPESIQVQQHPMQEIGTTIVQPMMMNGIPEGLPLSSTDFWPTGQNSTPNLHVQSLATNTNFQEFPKPTYESDFYSNM